MLDLLQVDVADGRRAVVRHSTRRDGDLSPATVEPSELERRRGGVAPASAWHALRQVHGRRVVEVDDAVPPAERPEGDALVTTRSAQVLVVHTGDCVPVGLVHRAGAIAVVHAGWRGLEAGVMDAAVYALRGAAGTTGEPSDIVAAIGPHIRAERYEFGPDDLERMVARFGGDVAGRTRSGTPALDLTAATHAALAELGVEVAAESADCTAADRSRYWSHRARGERGRIALTAWLEPA